MTTQTALRLPQAFILRRLHSLTGLFLVIYILEHLLTNSQAALFIGEDGKGFVDAVNAIHDLPYLPVIEIVLLGLPIFIHLVWGIMYLRTSLANSHSTDGTKPALKQYSRNHAYTWQRITSWVLVVGIIAHVIHMRFMEFPVSAQMNGQEYYMVRVTDDAGLLPLSKRLGFRILDPDQVEEEKKQMSLVGIEASETLLEKQKQRQEIEWAHALGEFSLKNNEVLIVANSFGLADLLMVRDVFKMPLMIVLYTLFVLAACYHGFNGLWTAMITWGVTLTERSQLWMRRIAIFLMILVAFLGLATIFGTYWFNLKQ